MVDEALARKSDDLLYRLREIHHKWDNLCYVTSWGYSGTILLWHYVELRKTVGPLIDVPVISVNTGKLHYETLEFAIVLTAELDLNTIWARAKAPCPYDPPSPECCNHRKVLPLRDALEPYDAWVTAIRHDQTSTRKDAEVFEEDGYDKIRIAPMLNWTKKECWDFIKAHHLRVNSLHAKYPSIGCEPCTNVPTSDDERSGRWNGARVECGIHKRGGK